MPEKDENINGDILKISTSSETDMPVDQAESSVKPSKISSDPYQGDYHLTPANPIEPDHLWSSPWANLMMVLFAILFLMISLQANQVKTPTELVVDQPQNPETSTVVINRHSGGNSVSAVTRSNEPSTTDEKTKTLMPIILAEIKKYIQTMGSDKIKATILVDHSVRISLSGSILFETDSTVITDQARLFLDKLAISLKKNRQQIHVIGHTDDQAVDLTRYPDKWALSLTRASTVARYLINQGKVEPYKFTIMGRSEYEPIAANLDETARSINRRVDIIVSRKISRPVESRL